MAMVLAFDATPALMPEGESSKTRHFSTGNPSSSAACANHGRVSLCCELHLTHMTDEDERVRERLPALESGIVGGDCNFRALDTGASERSMAVWRE